MAPPSSNQSTTKRRSSRTTATSLAATAAVAYGVYRIADWVTTPPRSEDDDQEMNGGSVWSLLWQTLSSPSTNTSSAPLRTPTSATSNPQTPASPLDARTMQKLRRQSIRNCRPQIRKAFVKCWPAVQTVLDSHRLTSQSTIAQVTKELKALRSQKSVKDDASSNNKEEEAVLWKQLQHHTLVRYLVTLHAQALLFVSLTLQLHWVAGQMMLQKSSTSTTTSTMVQTQEYFVQQGLPLLIQWVDAALRAVPPPWETTTMVTIRSLDAWWTQVQAHLDYGEETPSTTSRKRNLGRLLLPEDILTDEEEEDDDDDAIFACLDLWWDLVASPVFGDAQNQVLVQWQQQQVEVNEMPWAKWVARYKTQTQQRTQALTGTDDIKQDATSINDPTWHRLQQLPTVLELGSVSFQTAGIS